MYASCNKSRFHAAAYCTLDTKTKVLSTPEENNRESKKKLEQDTLYIEKYGDFVYGVNAKTRGKK